MTCIQANLSRMFCSIEHFRKNDTYKHETFSFKNCVFLRNRKFKVSKWVGRWGDIMDGGIGGGREWEGIFCTLNNLL